MARRGFSQKKRTNKFIYFLLWRVKKQKKKKIRSFVFGENLRRANLLMVLFDLWSAVKLQPVTNVSRSLLYFFLILRSVWAGFTGLKARIYVKEKVNTFVCKTLFSLELETSCCKHPMRTLHLDPRLNKQTIWIQLSKPNLELK